MKPMELIHELNEAVCVSDPVTYEILFLNKRRNATNCCRTAPSRVPFVKTICFPQSRNIFGERATV